jgi:ADP-ribosylglycohydrolase
VVAEFHRVIAPYSPMGDDVNHTAAKAGRLTGAYQPNRLGSIEELPLALGFCLVNDGDFRRSIEDGINSGRDTDSIGVMAGAILGAMHGEDVVGEADCQLLDRANRLDLTASADAFTETVKAILAADQAAAENRSRSRAALLI